MIRALTVALPLALLSCIPPARSQATALSQATAPSQTPSLTGDWHLIAIDGSRTTDRVILGLNSDGAVTIGTRCNGYWGSNLGGLRRLSLMGPETDCPVPDTDGTFLPVVRAQDTKPQLQDGHLILTAPTGQTLEFAPKGTKENAADISCVTCAANG